MRKKIYSFIKNEENEEKVFQYIQSNLADIYPWQLKETIDDLTDEELKEICSVFNL